MTLYAGRSDPASRKDCGLNVKGKSVKIEEHLPPEIASLMPGCRSSIPVARRQESNMDVRMCAGLDSGCTLTGPTRIETSSLRPKLFYPRTVDGIGVLPRQLLCSRAQAARSREVGVDLVD